MLAGRQRRDAPSPEVAAPDVASADEAVSDLAPSDAASPGVMSSRPPASGAPRRRESAGDGSAGDRSAGDAWVEVGRVLGAFGVHGAMKVEPWADPVDSVLGQVTDWRLVTREGVVVDLVVASLIARPDVLVAEFEPARTREAILAWKGATLSVLRSAFPTLDDDEYYWSDLVGCAVENREGRALGTVTAVLDLGADPLLQVDARLLIPFIEAYVGTVDVAGRRIIVDWSEDWS